MSLSEATVEDETELAVVVVTLVAVVPEATETVPQAASAKLAVMARTPAAARLKKGESVRDIAVSFRCEAGSASGCEEGVSSPGRGDGSGCGAT